MYSVSLLLVSNSTQTTCIKRLVMWETPCLFNFLGGSCLFLLCLVLSHPTVLYYSLVLWPCSYILEKDTSNEYLVCSCFPLTLRVNKTLIKRNIISNNQPNSLDMQQRQSQLLLAQHSKSSIKRWSVVWPSNSSCLLIHKQDVVEKKDPYDYTATTRKKKQKRSHHKINTRYLWVQRWHTNVWKAIQYLYTS